MVEDVTRHGEDDIPPCRGEDPAAVRRYIVACRASAVIVAREGLSEAARRLVEVAARAEQQLAAVARTTLLGATDHASGRGLVARSTPPDLGDEPS